jgi:hypothetical protein
MPYITQGTRKLLDELALRPVEPGQLNYLIARLCNEYVEWRKIEEGKPSYSILNEVIGVLACVQAELYRRVVAPFEDRKCIENGDVFTHAQSVLDSFPRHDHVSSA